MTAGKRPHIEIRGIYGGMPEEVMTDGRKLTDSGINAVFMHSGIIDDAKVSRLHDHGAKVFAEFNSGNPTELAGIITNMDWINPHSYIYLDVTDEGSLRAAVKAISGAFGRLDVVVANAGTELVKPFTTLTDKEWEEMLQVNLVGAARTGKRSGPAGTSRWPSGISDHRQSRWYEKGP